MKGPGPRLNDPLYLAVADRDSIYNAIKYGRPGTPMPPFGKDEAGQLTDQQIASIVDGMERNWAQPEKFKGAALPTYSIEKAPAGDRARGTDRLSAKLHDVPWIRQIQGRRGAHRGAALSGARKRSKSAHNDDYGRRSGECRTGAIAFRVTR